MNTKVICQHEMTFIWWLFVDKLAWSFDYFWTKKVARAIQWSISCEKLWDKLLKNTSRNNTHAYLKVLPQAKIHLLFISSTFAQTFGSRNFFEGVVIKHLYKVKLFFYPRVFFRNWSSKTKRVFCIKNVRRKIKITFV